MKWKPLVASLVVIAVAFGIMAAWKGLSGPGKGAGNSPVPAPRPSDGGGIKYDIAPLEDLPALDPLGLWPRHNQRLASDEIWIMWETTAGSKCRLLGTSDRRDWYELGHTAGTKHFLQTRLSYFDSALTFAVEFEANGTKYRSSPRTVFFGKGASFGQRQYKFRLGADKVQTWNLELAGRDATELSQEAFQTTLFTPVELQTTVQAKSADSVDFGVYNADILVSGTSGFLEVYDARGQTYDRVLMELAR